MYAMCVMCIRPVRYEASANISSLITLDDVMSTFDLGPNGGLLYCMEYLAS